MNMQTCKWSALDARQRRAVLQRPAVADDARVREGTASIVSEVRSGGDRALFRLTARYDGAELHTLKVGEQELAEAASRLPEGAIEAIDVAGQLKDALTMAQSMADKRNIRLAYDIPDPQTGLRVRRQSPGGQRSKKKWPHTKPRPYFDPDFNIDLEL